MSESEFELFLSKPESSILDFKRTNYTFSSDLKQDGTHKFLKDIICFANTVRTESAFIILGIDAKPDNTKDLVGLTEIFDEAILQDKIKDKTYPRPVFEFSVIEHEGLQFGIIEIPVFKYPMPISPTVKLKGLEIGKVYYRRGSTNTEALLHEIININEWLKSLPEHISANDFSTEITTLLKRTTGKKERLSDILADLLRVSKKFKLKDLEIFSTYELQGFLASDIEKFPEEPKYRIQNILISHKKLEATFILNGATGTQLKNQLQNDKDFLKLNLLFPYSISNIENSLESFRTNSKHIVGIITTKWNSLFPDQKDKDFEIYGYVFQDTYEGLYQSIRQRIIDKLVQL